MAVLSLPLSFTNSFWTQDYRKGLEVLFSKLHQGTVENDEIIAFISARASAEARLAATLAQTTGAGPTDGFAADDGATLLMAFRGLQAETAKQAEVHLNIAHELDTLVARPFAEWAKGHKDRLNSAQNTLMEGQLRAYESALSEVAKSKEQYLAKVRKADEAEDDAKFAPSGEINGDKFTTSPRLQPVDAQGPPQRSASVSERIAARLRDIQKKTAVATHSPSPSTESIAPASEKDERPKVDKGKARATDEPLQVVSPLAMSPLAQTKELESTASPSSQPPQPVLLAGLSFPPAAVSSLLLRARGQLPLRPVRLPILGEYQDCFTGDEFAVWLRDHVDGFGGSFDLAEEAARDLTERDGLLRRIGELRNLFEASDEAFYQFRPKAFELGRAAPARRGTGLSDTSLPASPSTILKRSNQFLSVMQHALVTEKEPRHVRARQEADSADNAYRVGVRRLDRQRLVLEQRIEEALKQLQQLEAERLRAVKTCLLQYHGTLSNLPRALESSIGELSAAHIAAFVPEADLVGLIERYRTGPFRPQPHVYESVAHDEADVVFGIDLRRWADGGWGALVGGQEPKEKVPPVVIAILNALDKAYSKMTSDDEKRKAWIYEVPLRAVHHVRETLNGIGPDQPIPEDALAQYDAPVLASTIKLWLLELDPPLALWEGWDEIRKIYPSVGSSTADGQDDQARLQALQGALYRWPKAHLYVFDALVTHIRKVIGDTQVQEPNEVYITKLALSFGRTIVRPKQETSVTLQDRHPAAFFIDIVTHYNELIPTTIEKKNETERRKPIRKRTAPVDMRMSRSRLSVGTEARDWLAQQRAAGKLPPAVPNLTTPIPPGVAVTPALETGAASEAETSKSIVPSEPVPAKNPSLPLPASTALSHSVDQPPRPSFKEPPPEDESFPPRPAMFKEPDLNDLSPIQQRPTVTIPSSSAATILVEESDPSVFASPIGRSNSGAESPRLTVRAPTLPDAGTRTPSPLTSDDKSLNANRTSAARSNTNDASRLRGPRGSRPPRASGGGSVSQAVSNLNKPDVDRPRSTSPAAAGLRSAGLKRASRPLSGISESKRVSLSRKAALSSRTMDSDAEDNIVG